MDDTASEMGAPDVYSNYSTKDQIPQGHFLGGIFNIFFRGSNSMHFIERFKLSIENTFYDFLNKYFGTYRSILTKKWRN